MVGISRSTGNSEQGSPGKPDLSICRIAHRKCSHVWANMWQGDMLCFHLLCSIEWTILLHLHNRRNCHGLHGDNTVYMYMRVKLEFLDVHLNVFSVLTVTLFSKFGMMTTYFKQEHFGELNHIGITVAPLHIGMLVPSAGLLIIWERICVKMHLATLHCHFSDLRGLASGATKVCKKLFGAWCSCSACTPYRMSPLPS